MFIQKGSIPLAIVVAFLFLGLLLWFSYLRVQTSNMDTVGLGIKSSQEKKHPENPSLNSLKTPELSDKMVLEAKKDLANLLNISPEIIQTIKLEQVTWLDTCLGGPVHSRCGIKINIPGYIVIFKVNDKSYEYHTGGEFYRSIER